MVCGDDKMSSDWPGRWPKNSTAKVIMRAVLADARSGGGALHDLDFGLGQSAQVMDETVKLGLGGGDLALERGLFLRRPRGGKLAVQRRCPGLEN